MNVAAGNSAMPLAWSECRWVITTVATDAGSISRSRSWAATAWEASISRSLKISPPRRPMPCLGSTATAVWKPVSISSGPAPGCSTRKAGTGALT